MAWEIRVNERDQEKVKLKRQKVKWAEWTYGFSRKT